jgi:hypothetical protein
VPQSYFAKKKKTPKKQTMTKQKCLKMYVLQGLKINNSKTIFAGSDRLKIMT